MYHINWPCIQLSDDLLSHHLWPFHPREQLRPPRASEALACLLKMVVAPKLVLPTLSGLLAQRLVLILWLEQEEVDALLYDPLINH
jgi:hypothetical protein